MIERKALQARAFKKWVVGRDKVAAVTTLERHSAFHFCHYLEVVSFHAEWAANRIEIGHKTISEQSELL